MNINEIIKNVKSIDDYINVTHEITNSVSFEPHLDLETVNALKKIKAFEVEYLTKSYGNGAASIIFERLLRYPESAAWAAVGNNLVSVLRYWLDAIRKHLILHTSHWWTFLKVVLQFINGLVNKDKSIKQHLLLQTAECLLDLSTQETPDNSQIYAILNCLNKFCANSDKEVRLMVLKSIENKQYFNKLGTITYQCGSLPCQYAALETLLRWLLRRGSRNARASAAQDLFPDTLCPDHVRELFVQFEWGSFTEDSRLFLNHINETTGLVTSVVCKKLIIGDVVIIKGVERHRSWLDINLGVNSATVLLPRFNAYEAFTVTEHNTEIVQLMRELEELKLVIQTLVPPKVVPSNCTIVDSCVITFYISSSSNLIKLDRALKFVFNDKYQVLMDLNSKIPATPPLDKHVRFTSDEDTRFSVNVEQTSENNCGYMAASKNCATPASTSTSSLAHLHETLEAFSKKNPFDKEVKISFPPQLPSISEYTEGDDVSFASMSTLKIGFSKNSKKNINDDKPKLESVPEKNVGSCLLAATVDLQVMDDAMEKGNTESVVDTIIQEALQAKTDKLNTETENTEIIDDTQKEIVKSNKLNTETVNTKVIDDTQKYIVKKAKRYLPKKVCTIVSRSTSEDNSNSNNDVINNTPLVSCQRKGKFGTLLRKQYATHDLKFKEKNKTTETCAKEIPIDPKVIVEKQGSVSSKDSDKEINDDLVSNKGQDENEVIDCLNDLVSKVCVGYLSKDADAILKDVTDIEPTTSVFKQTRRKNIKLVINVKPKKGSAKKAPSTENAIETEQNVSIIKESKAKKSKTKSKRNEVDKIVEEDTIENTVTKTKKLTVNKEQDNLVDTITKSKEPTLVKHESPQCKRKRKLYSPKDESILKERKVLNTQGESNEDDTPLSKYKTGKKTATTSIYRDIENERKIRPKRSLTRRRGKIDEPPSPRTLKMNAAFDSLIRLDSHERDLAYVIPSQENIYNFTSDSEDGVFDSKKVYKRTSSSTLLSNETNKQKKAKKDFTQAKKGNPKPRRKTPMRKAKSKTNLNFEPLRDLVDEKMRETGPITDLDSSITMDRPQQNMIEQIEPVNKEPLQIELIEDYVDTKDKNKTAKRTKRERAKERGENKNDTTLSPLPGLIVESMPTKPRGDYPNATKIQKMINRFHDNPDAINISSNTQNTFLDDKFINTDEEICFLEQSKANIDDVYVEKSKIKCHRDKKNKSHNSANDLREVVQIIEMSDAKSDKSIATDGITAHGEIDEDPPNLELMRKSMHPRQMEDFEGSMQDYFVKLNREINASFSGNRPFLKEHSSPVKPVVVVERLSPEDISRWLPSQRTSETDNSSVRETAEPSQKEPQNNIEQFCQLSNDNTKSVIESSPVQDVFKMSYEEFVKMFPVPSPTKRKASPYKRVDSKCLKHDYRTRSQTNIVHNIVSPERKFTRLTKKTLELAINKKTEQILETDTESNKVNPKQRKENNTVVEDTNCPDTKKPCAISPVRSFDYYIRRKNRSPKSDVKSESKTGKVANLENLKSSQVSSIRTDGEIHSEDKDQIQSESKTDTELNKGVKSSKLSSIETRRMVGHSQYTCKRKGENDSSPISMVKRRRLDSASVLDKSMSTSVASVNNWVKSTGESSYCKANDVRLIYEDTIDNILEKIDTSLTEMNQNTNTKLLNFCMENQKQWSLLRDKLTNICQEVDLYKENTKKVALELIRKDCEQKSTLVRILKEDIEAVKLHMAKDVRRNV